MRVQVTLARGAASPTKTKHFTHETNFTTTSATPFTPSYLDGEKFEEHYSFVPRKETKKFRKYQNGDFS